MMAMTGRPCQICADAANLRTAAEMIAAGASDQAVASAIGGISRMAVARHRQNHIERPAKAIVAAANKGKDVREEREQLVAAAEQGDIAAAFLSLERIACDLRRVQERLERTADAAEGDQQRLAVASLSGQQLRAAEVRAKLGGVGGYATPRTDKPNGAPFVLTINFSGGRTQRIEGTPAFDHFERDALSVGYTNDVTAGAAPTGPGDIRKWAREFGGRDTDDIDEEV
jgi:hypothetical protein